jgi:O-antigen/teichoic acid export membrane protein
LEKREIRTHYSGVIIFAAKIATVATGIAFALIVANSLSQAEYGILGIFNIIVPYFTLLAGAISFWTMRFVSRSAAGATKTGLFANFALAIIAVLVYLALLPIISPVFRLGSYLVVYLIMATQVVEVYLISVLESSLQANRPEYVGYGLLIGEILKVALCYFLVVWRQIGIQGVALSIVIAFAVKAGFYIKTVLKELRQKLVFAYVREWVKGSAFNIYNIIGDRIAAIIFLMITWYGTEIANSYYYATSQIANIIAYSTLLAFALTPKLLSESKLSEATMSFKLVLLFAIPMTAGVLALPGSYLVFLKETGEYVVATPVLMILAVDALILTTSTIFGYVLMGIERVDEKAKIPFREVAKSRLFIAFSLPYLHAAITLPTAFYAMIFLAHNDPLQVAIYITGINMIGHTASFLIQYYVVSRAVKLQVPWNSIGKYALASAVMAAILYFTHPARRLTTLVLTAIGGLVYVGVLLAIDKETRSLLRMSIGILKARIRPEEGINSSPSEKQI